MGRFLLQFLRFSLILLFTSGSYAWFISISSISDSDNETFVVEIISYVEECVCTKWYDSPTDSELEDYFHTIIPNILLGLNFEALRNNQTINFPTTIIFGEYSFTIHEGSPLPESEQYL